MWAARPGELGRCQLGEPHLGWQAVAGQEPIHRVAVFEVHTRSLHGGQHRLGRAVPGGIPHGLREPRGDPVQGRLQRLDWVTAGFQQPGLTEEVKERARGGDRPWDVLVGHSQIARTPLQQDVAEVVGGPAAQAPIAILCLVFQQGRGHLHSVGRALLLGPGGEALQQPLALLDGLLVPVVLVVEVRILRRRLALAGDHSGIADARFDVAGSDELDPEVPFVAVVEQEQELPPGGRLAHPQAVGVALALLREQPRLGRARVLAGTVPRLAAEKERPEVVVVEPERRRDEPAEIRQGLVGPQLDLAPDLRRVGRGIEAAQDADAEGAGMRGGQGRVAAGHSNTPDPCERPTLSNFAEGVPPGAMSGAGEPSGPDGWSFPRTFHRQHAARLERTGWTAHPT